MNKDIGPANTQLDLMREIPDGVLIAEIGVEEVNRTGAWRGGCHLFKRVSMTASETQRRPTFRKSGSHCLANSAAGAGDDGHLAGEQVGCQRCPPGAATQRS